jgi:hypothetical protein
MIKRLFFIFASVMMLASCSLCGVDGTTEGVFIKKPLFFGSGGVDMTALTEGSEWKVFSTDFIEYKKIPVKYTEIFDDVFCNDNTPMDLSAHLTLQLIEGKSPTLHVNYGPDWYNSVVKETFRKIVRNFISTYDMYTLTSDREVYDLIEVDISEKLELYFAEISETKEFPIKIINVVVDKAKPNMSVMEELNKTATMAQAKLTEIKRQEVEDERKITEHKRAMADKEYRITFGMTPSEYIQMRTLEVIENKPNAEIDVLFGNTSENMWKVKRNN